MSNVIDLTGQRFGKLLVLKRDMSKIGGAAYWICQCECGNIISTRGQTLRNGNKQDCGCSKKGLNNNNLDTLSLIGKQFGELTIIERDLTKPIGHGHPSYWKCQCSCGNITSVSHAQLTTGKVKSCGCLRRNLLIQRNTKDLTNQRFGMLVAKENTYQLTSHHSYIWRCECDCGNTEYYASAELLLSKHINSCGCKLKSNGELQIEQILYNNNILFIPQYSFKQGPDYIQKKRYDFAILNDDNNIIRLIEFDGIQHFQPIEAFGGIKNFLVQQNNDILKNNYAKQIHIPLVRIPYTDLDNITLDSIMGDKYLINR